MTQEKIMIVTTVSSDGVDQILEAIASAGGGIVGDYTHCALYGETSHCSIAKPKYN